MKTKSSGGKGKEECDCEDRTDGLEVRAGRRLFDDDAAAWLVGQGLAHMNACDEEGELAYKRVVELLSESENASSTIARVLRTVPRSDVSLRWSLLYLLAEVTKPEALDVFCDVALEPIDPRARDAQGCESPRDGEILVGTMAIEGIARLARSERGAVERLYQVIEGQPDRALRIEAVKALVAVVPKDKDAKRLRDVLPEALHFAIDLKIVPAQGLAVEYDSKASDKVRKVPSLDQVPTNPSSTNTAPPNCGHFR